MSGKKVRKVCSHCGSENVLADAHALWNVEEQKWELANVFDKGHFCNQCDGECSIKEVPVEVISIPVYAQNTEQPGQRCWDEALIESKSIVITMGQGRKKTPQEIAEKMSVRVLRGTREELLNFIRALSYTPTCPKSPYYLEIAKTIKKELE